MKTITILCDGTGAFRCAAVNNPDLFRRTVGEEAGSAITLFSVSPMMGEPVGPLLETLAERILPRFSPGPHLLHSPRFALAVLSCLVLRPMARQTWRQVRSRLRTIVGVGLLRRLQRHRASNRLA